jgi:hypothetical protein
MGSWHEKYCIMAQHCEFMHAHSVLPQTCGFLPHTPHKTPHTVPICTWTCPKMLWQASISSPRCPHSTAAHCSAISTLDMHPFVSPCNAPPHPTCPHILPDMHPPISPSLSLPSPSLPSLWQLPPVRCHVQMHSAHEMVIMHHQRPRKCRSAACGHVEGFGL